MTSKRSLPAMTIPHVQGTRPPLVCPRCWDAPKHKEAMPPKPRTGPAWVAAPQATVERYAAMGIRVLAQCGGCMYLLCEVEPEEVDR